MLITILAFYLFLSNYIFPILELNADHLAVNCEEILKIDFTKRKLIQIPKEETFAAIHTL